jgi:CHAT domain
VTADITATGQAIATRLLFLSANANDRSPLAVDREYNRVKMGLQTLGVWPTWRVAVEHAPAIAWEQVPEQLLLHGASIVHFAGHGYPDGSLEFSTHDGGPQRIRPDGLARLFESYAHQVRLVVLNACYSDALADALTQHVDAVVGMTHEISDEAAILFAPAFYQQLAGGKSVQTAFEVARGVLLGQLPETGARSRDAEPDEPARDDEDALPRVRVRVGVDASRMVFAVGGTRKSGVRWVCAAVIVLALLGASFVSHRLLAAHKLVVRTYEPDGSGGLVRAGGRITLSGPDAAVRSRPLVAGEAVFDDLPTSAAGRAVEVSVDGVAGFQSTSERHVVPESGILGVALARIEVTSAVTGTVFDAQGQPVVGAMLDFDHGLVSARTDQRGDFRIVVPRPPGAMVSVIVAFDGLVGFRDNLTVPGMFTLRWTP